MATLEQWYEGSKKNGYQGDRKDWDRERLHAQTDLFHLAKSLLGYDLVDSYICWDHPKQTTAEQTDCPECKQPLSWYSGIPNQSSPHREICNFFVKKNPGRDVPNQDSVKDRLLMFPRGSFKSSIDEADVVQWIITCPDIRIGLLTAAEDLGELFVKKIKSFFQVIEAIDGTKEFTPFQLLFPEHCISAKKKEADDRFTTPARTPKGTKLKEPSLLAVSLGKNTSGLHFDVGKYDDCVSNSNSGPKATPEQRQTIASSIRLCRALVMAYGYHDNIGTPYDESDAYAHERTREGLQLLVRPAWRVRDTSASKKPAELGEADYHILFPVDSKGDPMLTYNVLRKIKLDDEHIFACQYLVNPASAKSIKFTDQIIRSHIIQPEGLPQVYDAIAAWDFAYSVEDGRDFSVGCVGWFDALGRLYVVEIVRGRFSKAELAYQIAKQASRWRVAKIAIEKSPGADFLETDIRNQLIRLSHAECPLEFFPVDSHKNAKNSRAEGLENLFLQNRLYFSAEIDVLDDVIKEFVRFTPGSRRKDDIVDSVAHLARNMPKAVQMLETERQRQDRAMEILVQKQLHEMIYPGYVPPPPPIDLGALPTEFDGYPVGCSHCGYAPCICR